MNMLSLSGLSQGAWGPTVLIIVLAGVGLKIISQSRRDPLRHIPGPWYAPFTNLVLKYEVLAGRRVFYIHKLHQIYGPYVRVAPNEVSVADPAGYAIIHRVGTGFPKTDWYQHFMRFPRLQLFTIADQKKHSERRKLYNRALSESFLMRHWHDAIVQRCKLAARKIAGECRREGEADLFRWFAFLAMDVVNEVAHGKSLDQVEKGEPNEYLLGLQSSHIGAIIGSELPWLEVVLKWLPFQSAQEISSVSGLLHQRAVEAFKNTSKDNPNTLTSCLQAEKAKNEIVFDDEDAMTEANGIIIAGTDTTMSSLTYLIWAILSRPALQEEVEVEVAALSADFGMRDVEKLPILSAVIQESLRLYGPAQGALPRQVPAGGTELGGQFLPAGTVVSTQAYTFHRDPTTWPDAETFDHTRFLKDSASNVTAGSANGTYSPWGHGSTSCLGRFIAQMELHVTAAAFFRECRGAKLAKSTTPESMEFANYFLVSPKGHRCMVTLERGVLNTIQQTNRS